MLVDVLHVVPAFYPTRGGIEVLVENLAQGLNDSSGLVHGVLSPRVDGERPDDFVLGSTRVWSVDAPNPMSLRQYYEGIEVIPQESIEFARILRETRRQFKKIKPQVVHLHGFSLVGSAAAAIAETWGIPMVMHVHGSVDGGLSVRMRRQLICSDFTLAVSDAVAASIARETQRTEDVLVIRNGLPDPWPLLEDPAAGPQRPTVTMIGRLEATKGFDQALCALAAVHRSIPDLVVNIVGVGIERAALEDLARAQGLEENVVFWGRLDGPQVVDIVRRSSIVVVPSVALEGFSLVALEAAFLERPVVASGVGGLPETVLDGHSGTVVDPSRVGELSQAILRYITRSDLAEDHGRQARVRALREFSLDRMVSEVEAVHAEVFRRLHLQDDSSSGVASNAEPS